MALSRLWAFLAVALPVVSALLASMSTVDIAYHLRAGGEILTSRAVPIVDTWTFTAAGLPWVDQQWGAQVVFAVTERLGGWTGLAILRAALTGVVFACVTVIGLRRGLDARTAALLAIVVFVVTAPAMALRPQLLGMACFAMVLVLVTDRRAHPGRLWVVPVIVAVWANLHGSFFLGPVVLGLAWLEDLHDRVPAPHGPLAVAAVSAGAACLTPFGPWVWVYAVGLSVNPEVTSRITEWQPTSVRDVPGLLFFASVIGVVVLLARRGRPTPWPTLAWVAVFFLIGVYAQRGLAWWPLGAAAAIAGTLVTASERRASADTPLIRRLNLVVAGALILAAVALLPAWRPIDPGTGAPVAVLADAPPGITAALRASSAPGDHIFNPQVWGSWFVYALPDRRVAIDSRIEFFPAQVWRDYERVLAGGDGWEETLAAWDVKVAVVEGNGTDLAARLVREGWREIYRDADGLILRLESELTGAATPILRGQR